MTTSRALTIVVGARERRVRILNAFAGLLLQCRHTFDVSDTPAAQAVMERRQEEYISALEPFPIVAIEQAAKVCARSESGWFPTTGEWSEATRAWMRSEQRDFDARDQAARVQETRQARAAQAADPNFQKRWAKFCAETRAVIARKVMR